MRVMGMIDLLLGDPEEEVVDLPVEAVELERLVQPLPPLPRQVLQARVELVDLGLPHRDLVPTPVPTPRPSGEGSGEEGTSWGPAPR